MTKKILIIDDEDHIVEMLALRLESLGYKVLASHDGMSGLEMARAELPDLILLDVMMPKMDGYTVCKLLKNDEAYKHIPIIMLSARSQGVDQTIGADCGADDYATKPFKHQELFEKINKHLKE